jgi:AcrR family transcriptional regulator
MPRTAQGERKGAVTRRRILETATPVFNRFGYAGTSMAALVSATGLEKGGIYNHFASKDALAVAAFDHAIAQVTDAFTAARAGVNSPLGQLRAVVECFARWADDPLIPGGCPIVNTAVEADDTNPELLAHSRAAMDSWQRLIGALVRDAQAAGEVRADVDKRAVSALVTSSLEGAIVISRMMHDSGQMRRVVAHLLDYFDSISTDRNGT